MALARIEQARRQGRGGAAPLDVAVVALTALVCVAALVVGFRAMTAQVAGRGVARGRPVDTGHGILV